MYKPEDVSTVKSEWYVSGVVTVGHLRWYKVLRTHHAGSCPRSVRVPQYTNMSQFFSDHNSVFRAHSVVHLHSLGGEEWMKRSVGSFARKASACGSTG